VAKAADLHEGDRVRWSTPQGKTTGEVVRIMTKPFSIKGTELKASKDDPRVLVQSEKTGARAGHKPSALQKVGGAPKEPKAKAATTKDSKAATSTDSKAAKANDSKAARSKAGATKGKATSKDGKSATSKDGTSAKSKDSKAARSKAGTSRGEASSKDGKSATSKDGGAGKPKRKAS
jgi:hypothetical protein